MFYCLLDHKAHEHGFQIIDAPILQLHRELLRRNTEKIRQLLGVVKPEKMRKSSRHEDLKCVAVALAKLVMKEGEKPAIPAEPPSPVITVSADLAFRKHRCENTP